ASPASASLPCQARRAFTQASSSTEPVLGGASPLCSSNQLRTFCRYSACSGESLRSTFTPSSGSPTPTVPTVNRDSRSYRQAAALRCRTMKPSDLYGLPLEQFTEQ